MRLAPHARQSVQPARAQVTTLSAPTAAPASIASTGPNQLPYGSVAETGQGLRSTIQVELTYAPLRRAPVVLPVTSFVAEARKRPPEVPAVACVGLVETGAEKLVSLTRRTAMDLAGVSRDPDPAFGP